MHIKRTVFISLIVAILFAAGCTVEDGRPWGRLAVELSAEEPHVGEAFELGAFEVDVEELHLLTTESTADEPDTDHCHGDHCHGAPAEEAPAEPAGAHEVAHFEVPEALTSTDSVSLGEVDVAERVEVGRVDAEIHSLVVEGTLTYGEETIPMTIHLEHIPIAGLLEVHIGPDAPEFQEVHLAIHWPHDWLEDVHFDELEVGSDGRIAIDHESNHEAYEAISHHLEATHMEAHSADSHEGEHHE